MEARMKQTDWTEPQGEAVVQVYDKRGIPAGRIQGSGVCWLWFEDQAPQATERLHLDNLDIELEAFCAFGAYSPMSLEVVSAANLGQIRRIRERVIQAWRAAR